MTKKKAAAALAALGLFLGASGTVHALDLVTNGSFETTTGYGQPDFNITVAGWNNLNGAGPAQGYNFLMNATNGDTTGVLGNGGSLALYGPGNGNNNGFTGSPDGGNFIAADGAYQVGALTQTINGLTIGDTYNLSFYWAAGQQTGFSGATTEQWQVSLGAQTQFTSVANNADHGFVPWASQTFTYTASSGSELLSFLAIGTPNGEPPFVLLDGVSLVDTSSQSTTPEPTGVVSLFAGMIGLGVFARRRSRAAKSAS